jgi:hypothetical protein
VAIDDPAGLTRIGLTSALVHDMALGPWGGLHVLRKRSTLLLVAGAGASTPGTTPQGPCLADWCWCRRAQAAVSHGILGRGRRVGMTIVAAMVGLTGAVIAAAPARGCGAEA